MPLSGKSDLPNQTLDARATAILSKAFSDKVGGTGIGGYLKTALANEKGELLVPVLISGNFTKPKFAPDTQALLRLQTNKLLPGLDNPGKALSNMLDILSGKKKTEEPAAPGTPPKEQPKPNPLKDALEGLFGGKK